MLLFGHVGITFGAALAAHGTAALVALAVRREGRAIEPAVSVPGPITGSRRVNSPARWIDYRLILLGSLLPDIIDKPLAIWLHVGGGRAIAHTLVFGGLLAFAGLLVYAWRRGIGLLSLCFASMMHLVLDEMWLNPGTLFWPAYGWPFQGTDTGVVAALRKWLDALTTEPGAYLPEIVGASLLGVFVFFLLVRPGAPTSFLRRGWLG